jgi:hypothetical protein
MNRKTLDKRLQELYIYSDFYHRRELNVLAQLLPDGETLNCVLTGVEQGNRKMLAITDRRLLILFAGALSARDVTVIQRSAVTEYRFEKKLLFSRVSFRTEGGAFFEFTNTQGSLKKLFEWAMQRPLPAEQG